MSDDEIFEAMHGDVQNQKIFSRALDHGLSYMDGITVRAVFPDSRAIDALEAFEHDLPRDVGDAAEVIEMLHRLGSPATVAQTGGRYFGFVNGGAMPVSLAARLLADFWDQNSALSVMSPVIAKLESVTEKWLVDLLGLPEGTVAGFVSGTSVSILCGLAAGRYRLFERMKWDINRQGLHGAPPIRVITGNQAHATVLKAVALLGLGTGNVELVDCDDQGRLIAERVPELGPDSLLVLQAGNVGSGSFDPFEQVCAGAREQGAWIHIDGAFGLWAAGCGELRHLTEGIQLADSWSVDAHKTLNVPYDNGIVLCRDREALAGALQASGSYIIRDEGRDGMFYTPEMSRRGRVVELWAALAYLGRAGVDELVSGLHQKARQAADEFSDAGFQVLNDVVFNQVLVACASEQETQKTLEQVQQSGECWAGGTQWLGKAAIRFSVCSWATTTDDISRAVMAFVAAREIALGSTADNQ